MPKGVITSPNYPRPYSGNLYCEYLIQLPVNERIKIIFDDVKIESTQGCAYDSLEVSAVPHLHSCKTHERKISSHPPAHLYLIRGLIF